MELTTNHQMVQNNYSLYRQNCIFLRKITATNFLRKITASKFAPDYLGATNVIPKILPSTIK